MVPGQQFEDQPFPHPAPQQMCLQTKWKKKNNIILNFVFCFPKIKKIFQDKLSTARVNLDALGHGHSIFIYTRDNNYIEWAEGLCSAPNIARIHKVIESVPKCA